MADYVLLTDSSADLPAEIYNELKIATLPLSFLLEGKSYENLPDESTMAFKDVYAALRNKVEIQTSAANVESFKNFYRSYLEQGQDILYIGFSSGLSSTYSAGLIAAQEMMEEYPDRKILTVDSLCASLGQGLFVYLLAQKRKEGMSLEALAAYAEETKMSICHWFTVDDLFFLKRGGRVSGATALIGSMLGIKPVLHVDDEGHLISMSKVRGRKNAISALADQVAITAIDPAAQTMFICHGDCREDADLLASMLKERYGVKDVIIHYTGPVIGAHSGPGTLALFYVGTKR